MTDLDPSLCRVLVVEDEALIALEIEDAVLGLGWEVVGPVAKLDDAIDLAHSAAFECAILDVNVRGGNVYPLAEMLLARGVPVVLASGYSDWTLPKQFQGQQRLTKPFTSAQLDAELRRLGGRARAALGPS